MKVEFIQRETWDTFVHRLEFVKTRSVRWSWIAIRQNENWHPFAIAVRVPDVETPARTLKNDQVWIVSIQLSTDQAMSNLLANAVDQSLEIERFQAQDSYSAQWLPPGSDHGFGPVSGWPHYYTIWPLGPAANLRYAVDWQAPFRAGKQQYKTLSEACAVLLFGQRSLPGLSNNVPDGITVRLPYPYRLAEIEWREGNLMVSVDWSGVVEREGLMLHANWRTAADQLEPDADAMAVGARGGSIAFDTELEPVEVDIFLNDPELPVPCQERHWPLESESPVSVRLEPPEEQSVLEHQVTSPGLTAIKFSAVSSDMQMAAVLDSRWQEVSKCMTAKAHLATVVMAGSVLEGSLLGLARDRLATTSAAASAPKARDGSVRPLEEWSLIQLISVATELGWIPPTLSHFADAIRSLRNYVHPWKERSSADAPSEGVARLSVNAVQEILVHLSDSPPAR